MKNKMTRTKAYELMTQMLKNKNLQRHGLAVEAIMRSLCHYLKVKNPKLSATEFNDEEWGIVGLLHDADYELVEKDPKKHTLVTEERLRKIGGVSERMIQAIKAHHQGIKQTRDNLLESSVYAADDLSGLITAVALVKPDKKISSVTVESVMKKFSQKSFATGAKRDQILSCEKELSIPLQEFVSMALVAMQAIGSELGL